MSSLDIDVQRYRYTLMPNKFVQQRTEHVASMFATFQKIYQYVFVNVTKFDCIPRSFNDVFFFIKTRGKEVDGTPYGWYALTPHGRIKQYGNYETSRLQLLT